jgi:hypothetical protein
MYLIYQNEQQSGPFSLEELKLQLQAYTLSLEDFYWDEDTGAWQPISDLFTVEEEGNPPPEESVALLPEELPAEIPPGPAPIEEAIPAASEASSPYDSLLTEKQSRKKVIASCQFLESLLNHGETIVYVAVQKKPFLNFSPEVAVLTTERVFLLYQKFFNTHYDDYHLNDILNLELKKTLFGSHFNFKSVDGQAYGILYLPKQQGTRFYEKARELQEKIRAAHKAAAPANTPLPTGMVRPPSTHKNPGLPINKIPTRATASAMSSDQDTLHRLETLKKMLEENLISEEDYAAKKKELLDRL